MGITVKRRLKRRSKRMIAPFKFLSCIGIILAIEFLDELVYGVYTVALPLIQQDLHLSYTQLGLLGTIPGIVSTFVEPVLGIWGDVGQRKRLIVTGGIAFAIAVAVVALSQQWWMLLLGSTLIHPASGAFVSLSQATLMDTDPSRHEQNMARWVVAGSLGALAGSLALSGLIFLGWGWRSGYWMVVILTVILVGLVWRSSFPSKSPIPTDGEPASDDDTVEAPISFWGGVKQALRTLKRPNVLRWLTLLELSDLMLDIFTGLLPLYLISIGVSSVQAGLAVTLCTGIGLVGDILLIPVLERVRGLVYLRLSAISVLVLFPTFLLVSDVSVKIAVLMVLSFARTGWYPILKGQLYSTMRGQSSSILAIGSITGQIACFIPTGLGLVADHYGLTTAMWLLVVSPIALLVGISRQ